MFMPCFIGCVSPCFNIVILSVKFVISAADDAIDLSDDAIGSGVWDGVSYPTVRFIVHFS